MKIVILKVLLFIQIIKIPDNPHEGEEFGYVTEGVITIVIDNEKYQAKKGESFYIACDKPNYLENTTNKQAKAIWISAPPSF